MALRRIIVVSIYVSRVRESKTHVIKHGDRDATALSSTQTENRPHEMLNFCS